MKQKAFHDFAPLPRSLFSTLIDLLLLCIFPSGLFISKDSFFPFICVHHLSVFWHSQSSCLWQYFVFSLTTAASHIHALCCFLDVRWRLPKHFPLFPKTTFFRLSKILFFVSLLFQGYFSLVNYRNHKIVCKELESVHAIGYFLFMLFI